ncbi:MAG: sulfotransferase domain-containing protein [Candidatus Omnitrophica bacterium]|nr:sulfotransferase domain-containing protein [Candidatus Omnitrophota bacterium]
MLNLLKMVYNKVLLVKKYNSIYVIEYPKSGRTWLRVMVLQYFLLHFKEFKNSFDMMKKDPRIPRLIFTHDGAGLSVRKKPLRYDELAVQRGRYARKKIIFIVRDPRDVLVSLYFQAVKRQKIYAGTISEFIRDDKFGIKKILRFYDVWNETLCEHEKDRCLIISYESMHQNTHDVLVSVVRFMGFEAVEHMIRDAVQYASFENMQQMEKNSEHASSKILVTGDRLDVESFKTRRGKVGGYIDYLPAEDIMYIEEHMYRSNSEYIKPYLTRPRSVKE